MMICKCYSLILKTVLIEKQILTEEKRFILAVSKIENFQLLQSASEIYLIFQNPKYAFFQWQQWYLVDTKSLKLR